MTDTLVHRGAAAGAAAPVQLTASQALVRVLKASGVVDYYGVVGAMLSGILGEVARDEALHYVGMRHEAAGGFAAAGQFAGTGRLAVCLAEMGPGAANLLSSMGNARNNNLALLAVTTSPNREHAHPFHGMFMEWRGREAFGPYVKFSEQINDPARVPELVRAALREALTGRPGPVHLDLPADLAMRGSAVFHPAELDAPLERFMPSRRVPGNAEAVARATRLLAGARRPLVIGGGGVLRSEAAGEFRELVRALGAAATTTQMGLGAVDSRDPDFIGHGGVIGGPAVVRAMAEADVVLALGCRWSSWMWDHSEPAVARVPDVIHVDIDPTMLGRQMPTSVPIHGDARTVLGQLLAALAEQGGGGNADPGWRASLVEQYGAHRAHCAALAGQERMPMHPARVAQEVGAWVPDDALVVYDGGHTTFWSNEHTPAVLPRTRFHDPGMAHLGFGLPWALALKHAHPERTVVNITGDGAFGFTLQELDTARRYGLNVITVLHDNAEFGIIRTGQEAHGFVLGANLEGTDYVAIARAFGCHGERVALPEEVGPALDRAAASGLPAVVDVQTFFDPHPTMGDFRAAQLPPRQPGDASAGDEATSGN